MPVVEKSIQVRPHSRNDWSNFCGCKHEEGRRGNKEGEGRNERGKEHSNEDVNALGLVQGVGTM